MAKVIEKRSLQVKQGGEEPCQQRPSQAAKEESCGICGGSTMSPFFMRYVETDPNRKDTKQTTGRWFLMVSFAEMSNLLGEFGVSARGEADEVVSGLAEFHGSRMPPRQRGKLPAKCGNRSSPSATISGCVSRWACRMCLCFPLEKFRAVSAVVHAQVLMSLGWSRGSWRGWPWDPCAPIKIQIGRAHV